MGGGGGGGGGGGEDGGGGGGGDGGGGHRLAARPASAGPLSADGKGLARPASAPALRSEPGGAPVAEYQGEGLWPDK